MGRPKIKDDATLPQGFSITFRERFWEKVKKTKSCWLWNSKAKHAPNGYGVIGRGHHEGTITAHTASWILYNGPIPEGMCVLHNCPNGDNKACVNPAHLWLGTRKQNNIDAMQKGQTPILGKSGASNPAAKLTLKTVMRIRQEYALGNISMRTLAIRYGASTQNVCNIVNHISWKECPANPKNLVLASLRLHRDLKGQALQLPLL